MAITINCPCGAQLKAQDEHAGKKTKCPQCGNVLSIPSNGATTPAPAAANGNGAGNIVFFCGCGQRITAPPMAAGKTSKCPKCQQPLKIPAASATAVTAGAPPIKPPPPPPRQEEIAVDDDVEAVEDDEDEVPKKKKKSRYDDEDDAPRSKKKKSRDDDDDEDDDDAPRKKKKKSRDDDEEDDDLPRSKKKKSRDDDDEDDDAPRSKKKKSRDDDEEDEDEDDDDRPSRRKAKKKGKSKVGLIIGIVGGLVAIGGVVVVLLLFMGGISGPDLDYLTADAAAIASFRVGDYFDSDAGQKITAAMAGKADMKEIAAMEAKIGLKRTDVERVSMVLYSLPGPGKRDDDGVVIFYLRKPVEKDKILKAIFPEMKAEAKTIGGKACDVIGGKALHFASDRLILAGTDASLKKMFEKTAMSSGPLSEAISMIRSGRMHAVVGAVLPADAKKMGQGMARGMPPGMAVATLFEAKTAVGGVRHETTRVSMEAVLGYADSSVASKAKGEADTFANAAKAFVGFAPPHVKAAAESAMRSLSISQSGTNVYFSVTVSDIPDVGGLLNFPMGAFLLAPDLEAAAPAMAPLSRVTEVSSLSPAHRSPARSNEQLAS